MHPEASDPLFEFNRLVTEAEWFDDRYELNQMPSYEAVFGHIESHPCQRPAFGDGLLQSLKRGDGHLFMFCMGRLKWPEVEAELRRWMEDAIANGDRRMQFYLASRRQCFEEGYEFP